MTESSEVAEKEFEKELRWIIDTQLTFSWSDRMRMINEEFISMKDAEIERLKQRLADVLDPASSAAGPVVIIDGDGDTCFKVDGFFVKAKVIKKKLASAMNQFEGG